MSVLTAMHRKIKYVNSFEVLEHEPCKTALIETMVEEHFKKIQGEGLKVSAPDRVHKKGQKQFFMTLRYSFSFIFRITWIISKNREHKILYEMAYLIIL